MATLTIEYNSRNKTTQQIINGLLSAGIFHVKIENAREKEQADIKKNIRETRKMIEDIRKNGSSKYQNMDDFLVTLTND